MDIWASGMPLPRVGQSDVEFYVPEYLGPTSVVEVIPQLPQASGGAAADCWLRPCAAARSARESHCAMPQVSMTRAPPNLPLVCASHRCAVFRSSAGRKPRAVGAQRHEALADKRVLHLGFRPGRAGNRGATCTVRSAAHCGGAVSSRPEC